MKLAMIVERVIKVETNLVEVDVHALELEIRRAIVPVKRLAQCNQI
jgi:hypothetical protein